jgi:HEAT repeat protein
MKPFFLAPILLGLGGSIACARWQLPAVDPQCDFRGLCVVSPKVAWVSGALGSYARTADGGRTELEKARADLKSPQVEIRRAAIRALVHSELSAPLREEIQQALKDQDAVVRATAATATGNLGAAAVPAVPMLMAQLKNDSSKEARETAARALGRIGKAAREERRAVAPLRQTAVKDADPVTRVVALGALAMMEVDIPEQVTALRKYLHEDASLVRMKAAHALGMIGAPARAAAAEIVTVLERSRDPHERGYIARALGNVGDPASLPALVKAFRAETDAGARGEMQGAITRLGGKVPEKQ